MINILKENDVTFNYVIINNEISKRKELAFLKYNNINDKVITFIKDSNGIMDDNNSLVNTEELIDCCKFFLEILVLNENRDKPELIDEILNDNGKKDLMCYINSLLKETKFLLDIEMITNKLYNFKNKNNTNMFNTISNLDQIEIKEWIEKYKYIYDITVFGKKEKSYLCFYHYLATCLKNVVEIVLPKKKKSSITLETLGNNSATLDILYKLDRGLIDDNIINNINESPLYKNRIIEIQKNNLINSFVGGNAEYLNYLLKELNLSEINYISFFDFLYKNKEKIESYLSISEKNTDEQALLNPIEKTSILFDKMGDIQLTNYQIIVLLLTLRKRLDINLNYENLNMIFEVFNKYDILDLRNESEYYIQKK